MTRITSISAAVLVLIAAALPASAGGKDGSSDACSGNTVASLMMAYGRTTRGCAKVRRSCSARSTPVSW